MPRLFLIILSSFWLQLAHANHFASPVTNPFLSKSTSKKVSSIRQHVLPESSGVYHATYQPVEDSLDHARVKRKAKWAKWLGIGSVASLLLPVIGLLAIPAAIVSLVMAGQVKRDTDDKKLLDDAKIGKIFSYITIGIIAVALIVIIAVVAIFVAASR